MNSILTRRQMFGTLSAAAAAAIASPAIAAPRVEPDFKIRNRRIRQSVMGWCFNPMPVEELAKHCRDIGLEAMEGIGAQHYPMIKQLGLKISLVGSHGFARGPLNPANREFCLQKLRDGIDLAVANDCPSVITFTGMRDKNVSDEQAAKNCIECWKEVIGYAEQKKVNLVLEHLNSRNNTHPMKGHPGYFSDNVDFCVELIQRVGSPRMKLLFDIYHVQIMNGDVIRRLRQYKDVIGHIHTAGVPGRCEIDEKQEINYPAVMETLVEIGYKGFVADEFIPTWADKIEALRHAAKVCDV